VSPARRATLLALAAIALWGSLATLAARLAQVPPFALVGVALTLGGLAGLRREGLRAARPAVLLLGVYGLFAYHLCLFLALRLAPPVEANLVNYLWPLLIVVLSPVLVPGATLRPHHLLGALSGFAGAALLVTGGRLALPAEGLAGYGLAALAAVIWSTYSLLTKRLGQVPTSAVAVSCLTSGALALLCHALLEPPWRPAAGDLPALLLIGLGPMGAAFYLWDRALKDGDPRTIGTLAYLTPLLSTLLLAAVGPGRITPLAVLAAGLIVGGALLGTWPAREGGPVSRAPAPPRAPPGSGRQPRR
jgi:drug/metabolite transporter (DMT)-like permease